jgi:hypothetical protein
MHFLKLFTCIRYPRIILIEKLHGTSMEKCSENFIAIQAERKLCSIFCSKLRKIFKKKDYLERGMTKAS